MSCPSQITQPEDSDSDYGSDFTPAEEVLLNQLLTRAVSEHAPAESDATPTSPFTTPRQTPGPTIATVANDYIEPADLAYLQPPVIATLVTDIEDGIAELPVARAKVLGRGKPRSLWTPSKRPREGTDAGDKMEARSSPGADNRANTLGMCTCRLAVGNFGLD